MHAKPREFALRRNVAEQLRHGDELSPNLVDDDLHHHPHELRWRAVADGAKRLEAALLQLLVRMMHPILSRSLQAIDGLADSVNWNSSIPQDREPTLRLHLHRDPSVDRRTSQKRLKISSLEILRLHAVPQQTLADFKNPRLPQ